MPSARQASQLAGHRDAAAVAAELSLALADLPPATLHELGGLLVSGSCQGIPPEVQQVKDLDDLVAQLGGSPQPLRKLERRQPTEVGINSLQMSFPAPSDH